jgi:phosphatidylglycerophosphate synthase
MAHAITSLRLLAVVPAAWAFSRADSGSAWLLVMLVTVAIASDYVDGIVARRTGSASPRGMLFDHTTDCLFVTSGLAGAAMANLVPVILPVLVPIAFTQYVLDSYYLHRQRQLRMSSLGRWNGILYFAPLVMIAIAALHLPALSELARVLVRPCGVRLAVSTVASIIDRAVAPLRLPADVR